MHWSQKSPFVAEHAQSPRDLCAGAQGAFNGMQHGRLLIQERPPKPLLSHCGAVGTVSLWFLMIFWYAQVRAAGGFGAWIPG